MISYRVGILSLVLILAPRLTQAQGIDVVWKDCFGDGAESSAQAFDCKAFHHYTAVFTFELPEPVNDFASIGAVIVYRGTGATRSPFWHFENGGCNDDRGTGMRVLDDRRFCMEDVPDPWDGDGSGGVVTLDFVPDFHRMGDLAIAVQISRDTPMPLAARTTYYAFELNFSTQNHASCSGCADPGTLRWEYAVIKNDHRDVVAELTGPARIGQCVSINSPAAVCGGAVPTRATTWGQIKDLYR